MKLTAPTIRTLTAAPAIFDKVHFDERLPGFGLRVRASGAHSWMIKYRFGGKVRRMVLGSLSELDPGKAFETARDLLAQVRLGRDPAAIKAQAHVQAAETFGALLPRFLEHQRARLKASSYRGVEHHLATHAKPLFELAVASVTRRVIAERLGEIEKNSGSVARNRVRASLSGYFTWLAREGYLDANPVTYTVKKDEKARERVPSDDDLRAIWRALNGDQYGAILKLLILTGARRDEIGGLRWSEIDLDRATITLPPERTKTRREHIIPLSSPVLAILQAQPRRTDSNGSPRDHVFGTGLLGRGFQDWSGCKANLDARIVESHGQALEAWTVHDTRRAMSTGLHERFGVSPHVVETILGHVGGHKNGVAGVYNRANYLDERRRALERWGEHIMGLVTGKPVHARVIPLRGRPDRV